MDLILKANLLKSVFSFASAIAVLGCLIFFTKKRKFTNVDAGLTLPRPAHLFIWLGVWIVWSALGELAIHFLGMEQPATWPAYSMLVVILRIAAIGFFGPISEELAWRGLLFCVLKSRGLNSYLAIILCAATWAVMHFQYQWATVLMIFLDGIVLGLARIQSKSILVPIVLHIMGNLYSIYESMHN